MLIKQSKSCYAVEEVNGVDYQVNQVVRVHTGYQPGRTTYLQLLQEKLYKHIYSQKKAAEKLASRSSFLNVKTSNGEYHQVDNFALTSGMQVKMCFNFKGAIMPAGVKTIVEIDMARTL